MANNADIVVIPQTGQLYVAPPGTTAPTGVSSVLVTAFVNGDVGYWHEDGLTQSIERSTESLRAFQNADVIRTVVTESSVKFTVTPIETNANSVGLYYGTTPDPDTGEFVIDPSKTGGIRAMVIDIVDGTRVTRKYIPRGEVIEVDDIDYANGEISGYPLTIEAYRDETIGGCVLAWSTDLIDA